MSTFLWVAILAGVAAWLVWPRAKKHQDESTEVTEEPPEVRRVEPEKQELDAARRARERLEVEQRATVKRHHQSMEGVRNKLQRACNYMRETGLDNLIPEVWEMTRYWPSWVNMPDRWTAPSGFSEIGGEGNLKDARVRWRWANHAYALHFIEKQNYVPDDYDRRGELSLEFDGAEVCKISCSEGPETYDRWRFTGVEALRVGPWMSNFIELAGHLRAERDASTRNILNDAERERAARIDLGDE